MKENIFTQSKTIFEITFEVKDSAFIPNISEIFDHFIDVYSVFEKKINEIKIWEFRGYCDVVPKDFKFKIEEFFKKKNLETPEINILISQDLDWVLEAQKNFKPINVNKFFIYSSFYKKDAFKSDKICIEIDPGRAFGTGDHETTQLCIEALSDMSDDFHNILDLGTGSGILAIASSKIFPKSSILASDLDAVSIDVAKENAHINNVSENIKFLVANGFDSPKLSREFDLVIANILANPIIELSSNINKHLSLNGKVILSGFIEDDVDKICDAYKKHGIKIFKKYIKNKWCSLVLIKSV